MRIYLVGGAVRDALLGRPATDRDWLVTGSSEEELVDLGFKPVGSAFGVFLHPETHEEYSLPREVGGTVEGDLAARDLTINAMARDSSGRLIDPHGGKADIEARVLRHVGPKFAEDPARIFRVARFAAELTDFGFCVAPETSERMSTLVREGGLRQLSSDRVWAELAKLLLVSSPGVGVEVLTGCGAFGELLADWEDSDSEPPDDLHHDGAQRAVEVSPPGSAVRLSSYLLGLRGTHETLQGLTCFLRQCRMPNATLRLIEWTQDGPGGASSLLERSPEQVVGLLGRLLRRRDPGVIEDFVAVAAAGAPASGRLWGEAHAGLVRELVKAFVEERGPRPEDEGAEGGALASKIRARQLAAVEVTLRAAGAVR